MADVQMAQEAKDVIDDVLKLAELVSVPFPGVMLTEKVANVLVDAAIDVVIARATDVLQEKRIALAEALAATASQAATTARVRAFQDVRRALLEHRVDVVSGHCQCGWAGAIGGACDAWVSHVLVAATGISA